MVLPSRVGCLVMAGLGLAGCGTGRDVGRAVATVVAGLAVAAVTHAPSARWDAHDAPDPPARDLRYRCYGGDASVEIEAFGLEEATFRCERTLVVARGACVCTRGTRPPASR